MTTADPAWHSWTTHTGDRDTAGPTCPEWRAGRAEPGARHVMSFSPLDCQTSGHQGRPQTRVFLEAGYTAALGEYIAFREVNVQLFSSETQLEMTRRRFNIRKGNRA